MTKTEVWQEQSQNWAAQVEYRSVYNAGHLHTVFPCCHGSRARECAPSRGPRRDVVLEDVGHPETSSGPPRFPIEA